MAKMKIRVPIEVVVDVDGWNAEYGSDETQAEIRNAVKRNVLLASQDAMAHLTCVGVHEG